VRPESPESGEPERMLRDLQRQAERRPSEDPRRERIEELAAPVAVRVGRGSEAKAGGDELDVRARPRQRRGELVVVRRREGGRIGEQDRSEEQRLNSSHVAISYAVFCLK